MNTINDPILEEWAKWGEDGKQPELKNLVEMLVKVNDQKINALRGIQQQLLSDQFSQILKKEQQDG